MDDCNRRPFLQQVSFVRAQFAQTSGLPFSEVLSAGLLRCALEEQAIRWLETIYTPLVTLWVFLSQVISADSSCRAAVARLVAYLSAQGEKPCSSRTGAYCTARKNLPEGFFAQLVRECGTALAKKAALDWLWKGREVLVFDGSTVSMPDTPANQAAYPQPRSQKPGVGFPLARIAAVFSLACGAVLDLGICRYRGKGQSELGLLRQLWHRFPSGSILLADRYICSYFELALLRQRGIDSVSPAPAAPCGFPPGSAFGHRRPLCGVAQAASAGVDGPSDLRPPARNHEHARSADTRTASRISNSRTGRGDHALGCRDLFPGRAGGVVPGALACRTRSALAQRDDAHGRVALQNARLVRKEIWTHLLAYNLIRTVMAQAAAQHGIPPRTISFKGTLQTLQAFHPMIQRATASELAALYQNLFAAMLNHRVGDRPDRYEPRARKRRPKPYPLLMVPRPQARKALYRNH